LGVVVVELLQAECPSVANQRHQSTEGRHYVNKKENCQSNHDNNDDTYLMIMTMTMMIMMRTTKTLLFIIWRYYHKLCNWMLL